MKRSIYALFALILLASIGCNSKKNEKIDGYQEIMAIHDAVMPKMGGVNRLKRNLQGLLPNIEDSLQQAEIQYSIGELEESEELMQNWMHNWAEESQGLDKKSDKYQQFLKEQKKSIINVSDRIYHALEHGNKTMEKLQNK